MEDIKIKISRETRNIIEMSNNVIGNDGENLQGNIVFSFADEFVNGQARIETEIDGNKAYQILTKEDEVYKIPIKSTITKYGRHNFQLVITEGTDINEIPIFKSKMFVLNVDASINAEIEQPDEYPTWIEIANAKLNQIDEAIEEVDTAVENVNNAVERVDEGLSDLTHANEEAREIVSEFENNVESYTDDFNTNANNKTNLFNSNASEKTTNFNDNADSKLSSYNSNASSKLSEYNSNAETKTSDYNTNASSKLNTYNENATTKLGEYNTNASTKLEEYNQNASDKITEYDEHVAEMQEKIDNLEERVEDLEDNQLHDNKEGTEIYIDDAHDTRVYNLELEKESSQHTTTGKNIIGLGSHLNGYIDASSLQFKIANWSVGYLFETSKLPDTITFSAVGGNRANIGYFDQVPELNTVALSRSASNTLPRTITVDKNYPYIHIQFSYNTLDVSNIQVEEGSTATEYEEYTGGQPSPNPDYPQEVKTVKGIINYFNSNVIQPRKNNNVELTIKDQIIHLQGTSTGTSNFYIKSGESFTIPAGTYFLTRSSLIGVGTLKLSSGDTTIVSTGNGNLSFTLNEETIIDGITLQVPSSSGAVDKDIYLAINEGNQEFPYVPYGNNYVDVKLVGKNKLSLLNRERYVNVGASPSNIKDNSFNMTGKASWSNASFVFINEKNKDLTISASFTDTFAHKINLSVYGTNVLEYSASDLTTIGSAGVVSLTPNIASKLSVTYNSGNYDYIVYRFWNNSSGTALEDNSNVLVDEIQLEEGSATTYEEYKETIIPIPLNNNEISGIGNYLDELIVDKEGKVYLNKKVKKYLLNNATITKKSNYTNIDYAVISKPSDYIGYNQYDTYQILCNSATWIERAIGSWDDTRNVGKISGNAAATNWWLGFDKGTELDEIITKLSDSYIYYPLPTPDPIDLNTTVDLRLFKGVNNISNSEDANMRIRYVQDTQTVIDKKYNTLVNAIISLGGEI